MSKRNCLTQRKITEPDCLVLPFPFILELIVVCESPIMSQLPPSDPMEKAALALYYYAAELIKQGMPREDIVNALIAKGINRETAERMLAKLDVSRANVARRAGYRNLFLGGIAVLLSILPLFGIAGPPAEGFSFWVAIAVLAIGLIQAGRGILQIMGT
jgi:hypothetical protein